MWTDFTTAGSSNFNCNNARCWNPLCWPWHGLVALPTALYLQRFLVLSFEVRACSESAVDFTLKKVVAVVVIFKIEVARDFYVTIKQRISTFWGCLSTSRLVEESSLRRATVADGCLHRREPRGFKLSLRTCRSNSVSFHFTQTFEITRKSPCRLQSCPAQETEPFCMEDRRSMDPEVLTAKGAGACHRTKPAQAADRCARRQPKFRSTPNCSHNQPARLTSLSFVRVGNESRF